MNRFALLGATAVALLLVPVTATVAQAPSPTTQSLFAEQESLDIGEVNAGQTAEAVFTFHNRGKSPVRILRAKPS